MRFSKVAAAAAVASIAEAQRPSNMSICDYYTTALLKTNNATTQYTVLTLLVNTVVIGNYTKPNIPGITFPDVMVPGILAPGTVNGTSVNLLQYFDGSLLSTNRGGSSGVSVNFLDDGGAAPLMMNMPANGMSSNQYKLLTHLYQFFGTALGCSQQGMTAFPSYQGVPSQYSVHKFMGLDYAETTYFIEQVGLAAASFGVAKDDITAVATTLTNVFDRRCGPPTAVIPSAGPVLQSICITSDCPEAANATCSSYGAVVDPSAANGTMSSNGTSSGNSSMSGGMGMGSGSGSSTSGSSMSPTSTGSSSGATTGAAVKNVAAAGVGAAAFAAAAFFL